MLALTHARLSTSSGPALLVIDLPSRSTQTVALANSSGAFIPAAVSAGTQGNEPWGFVLDSATGAISGFDLSRVFLGGADRHLQLADVIPNTMAAGRDSLLTASSDASSQATAVLWGAATSQRLSLFSNAALNIVCVAAVSNGYVAVGATAGAAEIVLMDATGTILSRIALPGNGALPPLACSGAGTAIAVATTGQFLMLSADNRKLVSGVIADFPTPLAPTAHPSLAIAGGQTALASGTDGAVTLFNNASGSSVSLALSEPGSVVALTATADSSALLIGFGAGAAEQTALVAYFLADKEEIPVTRLGSAQGLVGIAVAAEP